MNTSFRFAVFVALAVFAQFAGAQSPAPVEAHQTQTVRFSVEGGGVNFTSTVYATVATGKSGGASSVTPVECVLNGRVTFDTAYRLTATARCSKYGADVLPGVVPQVVMFDGVNRSDAAYSDGAFRASLPASVAGGEWISVMMIPLSYPGYRFVSTPIPVGEFSKQNLVPPTPAASRFQK